MSKILPLFFVIVLIIELICFPILIYLKDGKTGIYVLAVFILTMEIIGFIFNGKEKS